MKTLNDIVSDLAREKFVEKTILNVSKNNYNNLDDLAQDIYVELLLKDEDKIVGMHERNELKFFITKMIINNLYSKTSKYYKDYGKWNTKKSELDYEKYKEI